MLQTTLGEPLATKERPQVRIMTIPGLLGFWALRAQTREFTKLKRQWRFW